MRILNPQINIKDFFEELTRAEKRILLLDYDGTLAPFRKERNKARPYPGLIDILEKIIQHPKTKVIIISGRSINDLIPLLNLKTYPEIWGSHGGERLMPDGSYLIDDGDPGLSAISELVTQRLIKKGWGHMAEVKPLGLAVHWRDLEQDLINEVRDQIKEWLGQRLKNKNINLHEFDGGLELRPSGITKKQAVEIIMAENMPVNISAYLGDDLTDEDAFTAMKDYGLSVLVRTELRPTTADIWLHPPEDLFYFLKHWY